MKEKINSFSIDCSSDFLSGAAGQHQNSDRRVARVRAGGLAENLVFERSEWYITAFFLLTVFFCSCSQKTEQPENSQKQIPFNAIPAELPPPIKAKYIDPDSILPPTVIPLGKQPKVRPAYTNVRPAGRPQVIQIPENLSITTFGENGTASPVSIPAIKKIVPALQPKVIPASPPVYRDDAIFDINYLSDIQGLPVGACAILEDSRGYLWFGGDGGIVRYDGERFFHYTREEGFLTNVTSLLEDRKGNIWIAAREGICSYDGQEVTHYAAEDSDRFPITNCGTILEDKKGDIWFANQGLGVKGSGVYCFDGENFTVFEKKLWLHINEDRKNLTHVYEDGVNAIFEDSRGHVWWSTQGSGVMRYDGRRLIHYTIKEGLIDNNISSIQEDSKGQIWFGSNMGNTLEKGLSCYKPNPNALYGAGGVFTNFTKKEGLIDGPVARIMEDPSGKLWFAVLSGGVSCYDGKNFTNFEAAEGLNPSANSIIKDSKGNIWSGTIWTTDAVVQCFQPNSFVNFSEKHGLGKLGVKSLLGDQKGNLWIGTNNGGVLKYDGQNFSRFNEEQGLSDDKVNAVFEDSKGNIWFATQDDGVSCFNGKEFTNYTIGQGLGFDFIWDVHEDHAGNLWFACGTQGGITRFNPDAQSFTQFWDGATIGIKGANRGIGGGSIFEDSRQNLWFGGAGWVATYNEAEDQLEYKYLIDPDRKDWIDYFLEDDKGNLWFGGESRLVKVDMEALGNKFTLFNKDNGLPDFKIFSIIEDKQKNIWIGSDKGLALMAGGLDNIATGNWIQYNKADGLRKNKYSYRSVHLDAKNRMWWGTNITGLTMLDLNTFVVPKTAPRKPELSHLEINQQTPDYRQLSDSVYSHTLAFGDHISMTADSVVAFQNYPATLQLPYDLNHLTFHFSAIDWSAPHKIKYSYYLEGLEKDWGIPSSETKADYRNLPYGTHTFKVKAIGEAQVWSEPFSYTFTIRPPWRHTWWAYALYALLTFGVLGWYIQRLRRKIRKKQEQLDRELYLNQELASTNKQLADINVANSRFVPKDFLHILGKDSLLDLRLGDQTEAVMTILFADIRGYTTLSERMTPEENFKFINAFLGRMGPIIQKNGGFISQYLGDGVMALFKENHELAIKASIEMQQALQRYNKKRFVRNRQALRLGIGLNTGKLMLGVIGDKNRYESGVISDAVNTASRMEGLTKIFGCSLIVSEKTLAEIESVQEGDYSKKIHSTPYRFLGKVKVKGKNKALKIYDFFAGDAPPIQALKSETKADFEKAVHLYFDRDFGKAADLLKVILKKFPEDVATEYYLTKAIKYVMDGVDADWSGVEEMVSK